MRFLKNWKSVAAGFLAGVFSSCGVIIYYLSQTEQSDALYHLIDDYTGPHMPFHGFGWGTTNAGMDINYTPDKSLRWVKSETVLELNSDQIINVCEVNYNKNLIGTIDYAPYEVHLNEQATTNLITMLENNKHEELDLKWGFNRLSWGKVTEETITNIKVDLYDWDYIRQPYHKLEFDVFEPDFDFYRPFLTALNGGVEPKNCDDSKPAILFDR